MPKKLYEWVDESSHPQSDEEKVPNCFIWYTENLQIRLHRHRDYPADRWLVSCYEIKLVCEELSVKTLVLARHLARCVVEDKLKMLIEEVRK